MTIITNGLMKTKYLMMPGRAAVTYRQQTAIGVYTDTAVNDAWQRDLNDKEKMASQGVYVEHEKNWFLPQSQYAAEPMPGDLVVSGGDTYTVLAIGQAGGLGAWKVRAVNLVLAAGLRDVANLFTPTNTQDAIGSRVPIYPGAPTYANVPCRIQEITGDRQELQGKIGLIRRYVCYLGSRVVVNTETQVRVNGITYQVRSYNDPDRIDALMSLDLEVLP